MPLAAARCRPVRSALRSVMLGWGTWQRGATVVAMRHLGRVSSIYGTIPPPPNGFVTPDIKLDMAQFIGGTHARGVFATREIGYGREIMSVPAFCMYIGDNVDEPLREQVLHLTRDVFGKLVYGTPEEQKYIKSRVMSLMSGGFSYFTRERDVFDFAEEVRAPGAGGAVCNGAAYLTSGEFSSYDLQKLPLIIEFNRFDVEYRGRRGICLFPEASYFNHSCDPNVELNITYNTHKNNFTLSARAVRPIREGEELFINYMPGNQLPISRFALAMRRRWGFECSCMRCKSRAIGAAVVLFVTLLVPIVIYTRRVMSGRAREKMRSV